MFALFLTRALLIALPFAVYLGWRAYAIRTGRPMGATPWAWLTAIGVVLAGLSLMATVLFREDNRSYTYVPAQAQPDGQVRPSGFDPNRPRPVPAPTAPNTAP